MTVPDDSERVNTRCPGRWVRWAMDAHASVFGLLLICVRAIDAK